MMMKQSIFYFAIMALLPFVCVQCSSGGARIPACIEIVPPDIHLTSEKTSVERLIIGDYREIESDTWVVASARTNVQRQEGEGLFAGGDQELFNALKIRQYHEDKIRNYKDEGALGEGGDGYVHYMRLSRYERDADLKRILLLLVDQENRARGVMFVRSARLAGGKDDPAAAALLAREFAAEQRAMARKNDWIQDDNGKWVQKQ
jgi:hypothetical protein